MRIVSPTTEGIADAAAVLRRGGVVAYPTETVYGLGVDPFNEVALARLFEAKGRDPGTPVLLIVGSIAQLDAIVREVTPNAKRLIDRFWPGPLSLLFRPRGDVPEALRGADGRICVRWTSCGIALALCMAFGRAIVSTSANRTGEEAALSVDAIDLPAVDLALDGGMLGTAPPSTVYDPDSRTILRAGAIDAAAIAEALAGA